MIISDRHRTTGREPVFVPAVRSRRPVDHGWEPSDKTRIVTAEGQVGRLRLVADQLADDLALELGLRHPLQIGTGASSTYDVVLRLDDDHDAERPEAYEISDRDQRLTLSAGTERGLFWATRTVLQAVRQRAVVGDISDWPSCAERGVLLDIGRKHFTPHWIKGLLADLADHKLNTLQLHISDGPGFGVECRSHPELNGGPQLSREDVCDILQTAQRLHIDVNADVDTPAHLDHLLSVHPELRLVLADGTVRHDVLDISNPAGRELVADLVDEMCELFDGPVVHLGGDEFFPAPWQLGDEGVIDEESAPQLAAYARAATGRDEAGVRDGFAHYLNLLAARVRAHGKEPRIFNDDVLGGPDRVVPIDPSTQVDVWIRWNQTLASATDYARAGHQIVNANGDYLYIILTSDGIGSGATKNPQGIYERWTPLTFMGAAGSAADHLLPLDNELAELVRGAHLSIWCDQPEAMSEDVLGDQLQDWLRAFTQQTWGSARPYPTWAELTAALQQTGSAGTRRRGNMPATAVLIPSDVHLDRLAK